MSVLGPPPPNDDVCNATTLLFDTSQPLDLRYAAVQPGEVAGGAGPGPTGCESQLGWCPEASQATNTVWFRLTVEQNSTCSIAVSEPVLFPELVRSSGDAQLALYSADNCSEFSSFTRRAANDNSNGSVVTPGRSVQASDSMDCSDRGAAKHHRRGSVPRRGVFRCVPDQ